LFGKRPFRLEESTKEENKECVVPKRERARGKRMLGRSKSETAFSREKGLWSGTRRNTSSRGASDQGGRPSVRVYPFGMIWRYPFGEEGRGNAIRRRSAIEGTLHGASPGRFGLVFSPPKNGDQQESPVHRKD